MNIYTEERSYWMGSDVARYRRKRSVSLPDYAMPKMTRYGICHPELCFGDREPEHLVIVHLRQYDVTNWRRRALFKLAWVFLRDALRRNPAHLHTPAPVSRVNARRLPATAKHELETSPIITLGEVTFGNPAADDEQPEVRK